MEEAAPVGDERRGEGFCCFFPPSHRQHLALLLATCNNKQGSACCTKPRMDRIRPTNKHELISLTFTTTVGSGPIVGGLNRSDGETVNFRLSEAAELG